MTEAPWSFLNSELFLLSLQQFIIYYLAFPTSAVILTALFACELRSVAVSLDSLRLPVSWRPI